MHRNVAAVLLLIACVSLCDGQGRQQRAPKSNALRIRVRTENGAEIQSLLKLNLIRGDMPIQDTYMDSRGEYTFGDLPDGSYAVRVIAPGFLPEVREAELSAGRQIVLNFHLRALPSAENVPAERNYAISAKWLAAPEKVRRNIEEARELRRKGEFDAALQRASNALKLSPDFSYALHEAGLCNWRLGQLDAAKALFQRATEADATFLPSFLNLAEVLAQQMNYSRAGRVLQEASKAHPTRAEPFYVMGRLQFETGHMELAEKALRMALERHATGVPDVYALLANIYIRRGENDRAVEALEVYLDRVPHGQQAERAHSLLAELTARRHATGQPSRSSGNVQPGSQRPQQ